MGRAWRSLPLLLVVRISSVRAEWTGLLGLSFESDVPVDRRGMHCPTGYITGLTVRHGRDSGADTDFYDFKLKCGGRWGPWSGMPFDDSSFREEKSVECPLKMHMTGLEVKQGRKEFGDVDTYDFKIQCSGVWQPYLGLSFSGHQAQASKECPSGTMAAGWRAYRGFVKRGDRDYYEFDLDCRVAEATAAVRRAPDVRTLGLSQNVFVWSAKDVGVWLESLGASRCVPVRKLPMVVRLLALALALALAPTPLLPRAPARSRARVKAPAVALFLPWILSSHNSRRCSSLCPFLSPPSSPGPLCQMAGLGMYAGAFVEHNVQGDVVFLLLESHLQEMGLSKIGDRLYFMEVLTQLHDATNRLSKTVGQLSSARTLPNLQRAKLPLEVVSWSVREVAGFLSVLGLGEWTEAFLTHRIQGDVMFSLTEPTLAEMGVSKIGDRLFLVDCLQQLYEELTSWKKARESGFARQRATVPALPGAA
jgi:hypothetical protein